LISEVFLDIWRQAGKFEGRSAIEDHADDPETTLAKKEKGSLLRQCLTKLSADHREIIDLVYYHEKSVEEVAEMVGIPEATVKTRMFYARKKLSELLREQGLDRGWP
jgi:RNA polymerase sigma-70 factor, ECF subfamily